MTSEMPKGGKPSIAGWLIRGGLLAIIVAVILAALYWPMLQPEVDRVLQGPLRFDRKVWDARESNWNDGQHRAHRMADEMLRSERLIGKTRQDVVSQLGEPPETSYFRDYDLVYNLGAERGFIAIDSEWLVLKLSAEGRVSVAELVTD